MAACGGPASTTAPAGSGAPAVATPGPERVIDDFEGLGPWEVAVSDQVVARLRAVDGAEGRAACLDFDFNGVSGHAAMRRRLPIAYPDEYAFSFRLRGDAPVNALQFKLLDDSGDNVWWVNRPDTRFPQEWTEVRYRRRHIDFAWGPREDRRLRESAQVEFTVYAGEGGAGEVCFDRLALQELPVPPAEPPVPVATASSERAGGDAGRAVDGDPSSTWISAAAGAQTLALDLGHAREFGGLVLHWAAGRHATRYDVEASDDGRDWRRLRGVVEGNGGTDWIHLPESEARHLRLVLHAGPGDAYALSEIEVRDVAFGADRNALVTAMAETRPRGHFPRGFHREQNYWTLVGIDGGPEQGLLSEDGAVEIGRGGATVEPFLLDDAGTLTTWADVAPRQSLAQGYMPIPSVRWQAGDLALTTTAFADGDRDASRMLVRYTLENTGATPRATTLALAVRPLQVNGPVQFLTTPGGVSPIRALAWDGEHVRIDGAPRIRPLVAPDGFFATSFDAGMDVERLSQRPHPDAQAVEDEAGLASGALLYRVALAPGERRTIALDVPLSGTPAPLPAGALDAVLDAVQRRVEAGWHEKLDRVAIRVPERARVLSDTVRTALAHILINRDGPMIRPGTRSYARAWIRDGTMTSEGLMRMGHVEVARAFLEWYAPYQFDSGKVPCCVDVRGSDPVPENDSHGQLVHLIAETWRYGRDRALAEAMWPHAEAALRYMDALRRSERTEANLVPERRPQYGLMPPSISHEGYAAKPAYSYWDDFWALKGYKDGARLAEALGREDAGWIAASRDEFHADLMASIRASAALHGIGFIPGAAELGDFDATSTTIALSPGGERANLPQDLLHGTFERYWNEFVARRDVDRTWDVYTPYELRNVAAFVRLGWTARAHELLDFFHADRRPAAWNQWAEVVAREPRRQVFIGDMPHGWVASDYIRSALDLFAYERESDAALVIAAGVPDDWLDDGGVAIERLRTPWGEFGYALSREAGTTTLRIPADAALPPGGIVFRWPGAQGPGATRIDGAPATWTDDGELRIDRVPAEVVVR
ncbi:discoidin domain-containing protein [Coralloluteibacterium thermophilus]|uniref:discoidin domain-containing protein n=1 Tax=Coralloluteibacterium thermophilum TaxID=2707049 RepID=UPI003A913059